MSEAITLEARLEAVEKDLAELKDIVRRALDAALGMSIWSAR